MDIGFRTHSVSRRDLLRTGAFSGLASLLGSAPVSAQCVGWSDEIQPTAWALYANQTQFARFRRLDALEQFTEVKSKDEIDATPGTSRLPGRRKAPSAQFGPSANIKILKKWYESVLTDGPVAAMKTLQLRALGADGSILRRYLLRNCFPADLTNAFNANAIQQTKLVCGRAEAIDDGTEDHPVPCGPWFELWIDGVLAARFLNVVGLADEIYDNDVTKSADGDVVWAANPPSMKPVQLKLGKTRDSQHYIAKWHESARTGLKQDAKREVRLLEFAADGSIKAEYELGGSWLSKYNLSALVVKTLGQTLYKEVTITCDSVRKV